MTLNLQAMLPNTISPKRLIADNITLTQLKALFDSTDFKHDVDRRVIQTAIKADAAEDNDINKSLANGNGSEMDRREAAQVDRLIRLFNVTFAELNVILVRGDTEPEYFPANYHTPNSPAKIVFAHGFFASALHEISHWCIAGKHRRTLNDFGYWYAPDGRSEAQQRAFEKVEIKPQAIECLFNLACGRTFRVSQDNLFADFDTSDSTFEQDVYRQVSVYLQDISTLPQDALTLIRVLRAVDW